MISRREALIMGISGAMALSGMSKWASAQPAQRPNVLFLAVDDLNDWIGCLGGHPQVKTPNLDALAASGMLFANAHCPGPICNPARASLLTGLHPTRTGIHFLSPLFRQTPATADAVTLPEHFRNHGYHTMSVGKVFHERQDAQSFDELGGQMGYGPRPSEKISYPKGHPLWDWGAFPEDETITPDFKIADWASQRLQREYDKPFFLAAGFYRPHVPMYAPMRFFDLYPPGKTTMPPTHPDEMKGISEYAMKLTHAGTAPRHSEIVEIDQWEHAVRSYLASVSFMDHQVGRLLQALAQSAHARNTIVVFWADHGFHLGERQRWEKRSLWERSTHVPLILAGPGIAVGQCKRSVGIIDLYPTLVDLCGLPKREGLDGQSMQPLIHDASADWRFATLSSFGPGNHALRSDRWRYIRYADGSEELYDHTTDPHEWHNLAGAPQHASVLAEHRRHLPKDEAQLAPGSSGSDSPLFD